MQTSGQIHKLLAPRIPPPPTGQAFSPYKSAICVCTFGYRAQSIYTSRYFFFSRNTSVTTTIAGVLTMVNSHRCESTLTGAQKYGKRLQPGIYLQHISDLCPNTGLRTIRLTPLSVLEVKLVEVDTKGT